MSELVSQFIGDVERDELFKRLLAIPENKVTRKP